MSKSFKKLKKFINIRNFCFFIFKISTTIILFIFLSILCFIIIFSIKPRNIIKLNDYIFNKINQKENVKITFDKNNTTLVFDKQLGLKYQIKDFKINVNNSNIKLSDIIINLDFLKLLIGKFEINEIILSNSKINIKSLEQTIDKKEKKNTNIINVIQNNIQKLNKKNILIRRFILKDFIVDYVLDDKKNIIKIINSTIKIKLKKEILQVFQNTTFNINNNILDSNLQVLCNHKNNTKNCKIDILNLNPNDFKNFFNTKSSVFNYLDNISGYFDIKSNIFFTDIFKIKEGNVLVKSKLGFFYFKNFFDEKLFFKDFILNITFDDFLKNININSLTTKFDHVDFFMSLFFNENDKYKNLDLNFDIKNAKVSDLKKLWPNFLGADISRPWVLSHFISGDIPKAYANLNFKYFNDKNKNSGLNSVDAKIDLKNVSLNYSDDFPIIKNIDAEAFFTKNDMKIYINSAKTLNSKLSNGFVGINFNESPLNLTIKSNINGPFFNLFVFIDKNKELIIKNSVDSFLEDYKTLSTLNLEIPLINNLSFSSVLIEVDSNVFVKRNSILTNNNQLKLSFIKEKNTNSFFGKINLTDSELKYVPLNIIKEKGTNLNLDYFCSLENNSVVRIKDIESNNDFIKFDIDGFIDIKNDKIKLDIKNINLNNSFYNVFYNSNVINETLINDIKIRGKNINYSNILDKLQNNSPVEDFKEKESQAKNKTYIDLKLDYLNFKDNKKIYNPILKAEINNNDLKILNFNANINKKENVELSINKKTKMFNLKSENFGNLFQIIGLTDKIIGGAGEINFNQKTENKKSIIFGNIDINKEFKIITGNESREEIIKDTKEEKKLNKLTKNLIEESAIRFDKMRGNIMYTEDVINFNEIVANSDFINLQILASGFLNLNTEELQIKGLLMPMSSINGLFGLNELPFIGDIIFGKKNAGLFASKFIVFKKDKNSKLDFNIDKFSMIMPGVIRNIFNLDTYKNFYNDIIKK